jgi:hypothetical protein
VAADTDPRAPSAARNEQKTWPGMAASEG